MLRTRILWSIALGVLTSVVVAVAASTLPYSQARDRVIDAFAIPGAFIVGLVYPQGVHTGGGIRYWGALVLACNFLIYVLFWYACLCARALFRKGKHSYDGGDVPVRRAPK